MKKIILGSLIFLLFCHPVLAEKTIVSEFDGFDWQGWTEIKKFNFLSGFLLGSSHVIKKNEPFMPKADNNQQFDDMRKRLSSGHDKKKKSGSNTFSKEEVILWGHYRASMIQNGLTDYAVYEITVSQLSQGMDELYKDSRNMKIKIADAIYTVKKQIKGTSPGDIEKNLMYLRGD
jgi:hypothetical protein